jgi:hypothetical protein
MICHALPAHAANLVTNGSFENNGGLGELAGGISYATGWTVGATVDAAPYAFDFVLDNTADSTGFQSVFSPPNILLWGPNTPVGLSSPTNSYPSQHAIGPVANGFTSSPDGGDFFGSDAAYATAPISQVINGLTAGHQYTLSFDYAGAQFTDALGPQTEGWQVSFGSNTVNTPTLSNTSTGFTGWQTYSTTFTATSASETLSFLAQGGPTGLPPFALLDGVSLTDTTSTTPEPASMLLLLSGIAGVFGVCRLRKNCR